MVKFILIASVLVSAWSARVVRTKYFTTTTASDAGMCAASLAKESLPLLMPLICSGPVSNLEFIAEATGSFAPRLRLSIDGEDKGYRTFPVWPEATRVWRVNHGSLSVGTHWIRYTGDRLMMRRVTVTGAGDSCSFIDAGGYDAGGYTSAVMDTLYRVMGPDVDFTDLGKKQLHMAGETIGTTSDGSISATVISDGFWSWLFKYHQDQYTNDTWLSRKREGGMFPESDLTPYKDVNIDRVRGSSGTMTIIEPCNTVSNFAYAQAAVWRSCQWPPYTEVENAVLTAGYSALAASSGFFHASATDVGQNADRFAMEMIFFQFHQLSLKTIIAEAGSALTESERATLLYLGKPPLHPEDVARGVTSLFKQGYNRDAWSAGIVKYKMPFYMDTIIAMILTWKTTLEGNWPLYGPETLVNGILDLLLGALDADWVERDYMPVLRKAFQTVKFCGDSGVFMTRMMKFFVTFVDAFTYQEEQIQVPDWVRSGLDALGFDVKSDMVETWDLYSGRKSWCDSRSLHARWHEKSAHGLLLAEAVIERMLLDVRRSC